LILQIIDVISYDDIKKRERGKIYMNNTKIIGALIFVIYCFGNESENKAGIVGLNEASITVAPLEDVTFEDLIPEFIDAEHNGSKVPLEYLFGDCYRCHNAKACQELLAFAAFKIISDKNELRAIINSQEQTIITQRDTLKVYNELNERRHARLRKRKQEQEKALFMRKNSP
jgi:hypothetical protein